VNFGTPLSVRSWLADRPGVLDLPREERLPRMQELADTMLQRIGDVIPVTPVPLAAAALLSFGETLVRRADLLDRIGAYREHLLERDAKLVHAERTPRQSWSGPGARSACGGCSRGRVTHS